MSCAWLSEPCPRPAVWQISWSATQLPVQVCHHHFKDLALIYITKRKFDRPQDGDPYLLITEVKDEPEYPCDTFPCYACETEGPHHPGGRLRGEPGPSVGLYQQSDRKWGELS